MMPRTLAPSNPSRGIDQLGVSDSLMMNANNNSPNSAVGGGSAMDDLLDRLQNATAATDVAGLGGGGGVTKTSFEHKQIPQDHNAHDLDRIHHGTNNADKASDILKKPPMGKGIGVGKKGGVDIKLIKQKDVSVTKGKSKTSTKKFGSRKRRTSSHSKGDDVIFLKKAETRTISALPQPRMKPKPRHHAWESDLQQQQSQSHSQDDADSEDPLPEVNTLAGETATMTKTTGSGSLSLPHQEQPQKHIGKRGIFTAHKNRKLQKELNKKNKAGVGTKKKQSMLSSVLRLDEEEVEEGFQDAKIRQGIEMARRSRNVQQSWKTPYEIDAPRTITVHRLQKPEQSDLPTNYLPEILVEKGTTGTAKGGGKSNNAESQSNTNDSIEFSTGSITGGNDNDSDTRSTEQRIWDGIEILLAEAFSENEGDTHSDSLRSHMSQLEDILPGQLLRAMGDNSVSSMLSITSPSKQQQHQKNNKDSIVFDNRDHSKALWETLKKADASRSGSMSIGTTSNSGGDLSQDEIGMARVTLNSFMDLLVPNQKEQEDGDDVVDMQGMTASASSRRNSSGGNMPRPSTADAEYALNNFMNALIGSLEDDLRKDPEKMSLDEQVQQIRKTQSTLTLFELFRWSLQVNVDATERTQYRNTHPHVHQHHPQQQRKKEKKGTTQKTNLPSSLLAPPPPPPHATEGGGTPPSQEPHDHHQHLQPLPSPPPQSSTVPSWAANIVMSESSPLVSSSQSRSGDYGHGPLHGGRRGVAGRSQSPAPSSHLSDSVLLPSSFVDGVNEIMQMNEDTASKSRSGSGSGQLSRTNSGEMPELASISDESTSLPSYTGTGDSDSSSSSGTGTSTDGSLSFATASDEHPVPNEEQEKDGSRVGGVGAVPTGVVVDGDITTTRDRSNKKEEEKSEDDTPNDGPPAVGLVPSNSSSSKSSNMMLAPNMIASNNDKATTLPNNKIKNATATTTARKMYKTTKLTPNDAALLSNDKKTTATGYTPYHTATTKRPQVMSAAGDVFSDDMSHSSLERYKAEFGPPQKAKQQQLKKKKGTKATGKNSKGSGNGSKKSSQPRSKSPTSNIKTVGRAGDVAVLPVQHRTVDVPHDLPESVDDDLTIDSTLKKDHDRDPTIVNRANIPRTKKNKYEKNKSEGRRSGFFGAWFGKSKRRVNSKDDGKKGKGKGKNDSSPSSRRLQYTSAVDNADGASGSFKNNKISKKGGGTGGGAKTKTLMKSRRSITQSDKKRSVMTASTQPTSSRRSIPWKREPSDGVKCLMHEEERGYDEAPIIAR